MRNLLKDQHFIQSAVETWQVPLSGKISFVDENEINVLSHSALMTYDRHGKLLRHVLISSSAADVFADTQARLRIQVGDTTDEIADATEAQMFLTGDQRHLVVYLTAGLVNIFDVPEINEKDAAPVELDMSTMKAYELSHPGVFLDVESEYDVLYYLMQKKNGGFRVVSVDWADDKVECEFYHDGRLCAADLYLPARRFYYIVKQPLVDEWHLFCGRSGASVVLSAPPIANGLFFNQSHVVVVHERSVVAYTVDGALSLHKTRRYKLYRSSFEQEARNYRTRSSDPMQTADDKCVVRSVQYAGSGDMFVMLVDCCGATIACMGSMSEPMVFFRGIKNPLSLQNFAGNWLVWTERDMEDESKIVMRSARTYLYAFLGYCVNPVKVSTCYFVSVTPTHMRLCTGGIMLLGLIIDAEYRSTLRRVCAEWGVNGYSTCVSCEACNPTKK